MWFFKPATYGSVGACMVLSGGSEKSIGHGKGVMARGENFSTNKVEQGPCKIVGSEGPVDNHVRDETRVNCHVESA
jgi:hypothetical protein